MQTEINLTKKKKYCMVVIINVNSGQCKPVQYTSAKDITETQNYCNFYWNPKQGTLLSSTKETETQGHWELLYNYATTENKLRDSSTPIKVGKWS